MCIVLGMRLSNNFIIEHLSAKITSNIKVYNRSWYYTIVYSLLAVACSGSLLVIYVVTWCIYFKPIMTRRTVALVSIRQNYLRFDKDQPVPTRKVVNRGVHQRPVCSMYWASNVHFRYSPMSVKQKLPRPQSTKNQRSIHRHNLQK